MRFRRLSLLTRITGGSLLIAVLLSVGAGMVLTDQIRDIIFQGEEGILRSVAAPYGTALQSEPAESLDRPGPGQLVAVVDPDGRVRLDALPADLAAALRLATVSPGGTRVVTVGSIPYLVHVTGVNVRGAHWRVVVARDGRTEASLRDRATTLVIASLVVLNIGLGTGSWVIAYAALRPVSRMRRSAESLVDQPGGELLPVGPAEDEVARLARTLNELISHLRESAARERQIVSDASHELRTPLAILQTQLELAQSGSSTADELRGDLAAAQATLVRLSALATSLLELSRIDAQTVGGHASVDELARELTDAADRGRLRASGRARSG
jgi:two-component system OmpR family sensor kinase